MFSVLLGIFVFFLMENKFSTSIYDIRNVSNILHIKNDSNKYDFAAGKNVLTEYVGIFRGAKM